MMAGLKEMSGCVENYVEVVLSSTQEQWFQNVRGTNTEMNSILWFGIILFIPKM